MTEVKKVRALITGLQVFLLCWTWPAWKLNNPKGTKEKSTLGQIALLLITFAILAGFICLLTGWLGFFTPIFLLLVLLSGSFFTYCHGRSNAWEALTVWKLGPYQRKWFLALTWPRWSQRLILKFLAQGGAKIQVMMYLLTFLYLGGSGFLSLVLTRGLIDAVLLFIFFQLVLGFRLLVQIGEDIAEMGMQS